MQTGRELSDTFFTQRFYPFSGSTSTIVFISPHRKLPQFPFYFPGEASPSILPATGVGADVQLGRGDWNVTGEWQRFQMDYHAIPTLTERAGYGEVRLVLNPRWYAATRLG